MISSVVLVFCLFVLMVIGALFRAVSFRRRISVLWLTGPWRTFDRQWHISLVLQSASIM